MTSLSVWSSLRTADCWKSRPRPTAVRIRVVRLQPSASSTSRRASEGGRKAAGRGVTRSRSPGSRSPGSRGLGLAAQLFLRAGQPVAEAPDRLDPVGADLLAHPADEHLDG